MVKKIVALWKDYKKDMGLGAMGLIVIFYNSLLFTLSGVIFGYFNFYIFIPILIYLAFFLFRKRIIHKNKEIKFLCSFVPLGLAIGINYLLVGHIDRLAGSLPRMDQVLVDMDYWIFGMQGAQWIWKHTLGWNEVLRVMFYDYLVLSNIIGSNKIVT